MESVKILNLCRSCKTDFASVAAFDRQRTGTHEYTFMEGLKMAPVEDGRRCLDPDVMEEHGMAIDRNGRWKIIPTEAQKAFYEQNSSILSASQG